MRQLKSPHEIDQMLARAVGVVKAERERERLEAETQAQAEPAEPPRPITLVQRQPSPLVTRER